MTQIIWIGLIAFTAIMAEVFLADIGILFPGAGLATFYLCVGHHTASGFAAGAFTCISVEILFGRNCTALPLLVPILWYGIAWRRSGNRSSAWLQTASGGLIGFGYSIVAVCGESAACGIIPFVQGSVPLGRIAVGGLISAIVFPLLISFFDLISGQIEVPQFCSRNRTGYGP